jgi:hypothetical protein
MFRKDIDWLFKRENRDAKLQIEREREKKLHWNS